LQVGGTFGFFGGGTGGAGFIAAVSNIVAAEGVNTTTGFFLGLGVQSDGRIVEKNPNSSSTYAPWDSTLSAITNAAALKCAAGRALILLQNKTLLALKANGQDTVPEAATNVVAIMAVGHNQAIAQRADGVLIAWGDVGQTGQDQFPDTIVHPVQMAVGESHTAALLYSAPGLRLNPVAAQYKAGQPATLTAGAPGNLLSTYQWQLNGINITGATNALLNLSSLRWTNSGIYSVIISNCLGVCTNTPASMNVPRSQLSLDASALRRQPPALIATNASGAGAIITLASTNLADWTPVATNQSSLDPVEIDALPEGDAVFYRAVEQP
jgi:hypothetical protein